MEKAKNVLVELYNGEIVPHERARSAHYDEAYRHYKESYNAFRAKLPAELTEEFEMLLEEHLDLTDIDAEDDFIHGFKLGARMMKQVEEA